MEAAAALFVLQPIASGASFNLSNLNLIGLFSKGPGKGDLENLIID